MFHYLGRKASYEVLHDVVKIKSPLMGHDTSVFPFFSSRSSISTSPSGSRFSPAISGGLGRRESLRVLVAHGNSYSPFTNTSWFLIFLT